MTTDVEMLRAVYLTAEDMRTAASLLYNAYHDDPFFIHSFGDEDLATYEQKLRAVIREELNELWQQEQPLIGAFEGDRLVGVACVLTPQLPIGEERYWHWRLKMVLGSGWQSTKALMNREASILEKLPDSQFGVIQFIAVLPSERRKGIGSCLVEAVLSWCDEQRAITGIGVFVSNANDLGLFKRYDFEEIADISISGLEGQLLIYKRSDHE